MRRALRLLVVPAAFAIPNLARADGTTLRADLIEAKSIKLDGIPKEWGGLVSLGSTLKGHNGKPDCEARAGLAYDANNLYVAADVNDDALRGGGGDRIEVVLGFPGGTVHSVSLYPGEPGKSAGVAKMSDGSAISGAKVIEAPRAFGWSLEASIPWSAIPSAKQVRVGLRAAIFVHDVDGSGEKNVIGTAPSASYGSLPPLETEAEQSLREGLLKDKSIRTGPKWSLVADVAGDSMKERVLVYDRYLVVLGSNFRKGTEYYFADLGTDAAHVLGLETRDVTGDGQSEIIVRKRFGSSSKYREMMQILHFGSGDVPTSIFAHELGVSTDAGSVTNDVSFVPDGSKTSIKITPGTARSFNVGNYREPTESSYDSVILPWGSTASQLYRFSGNAFVKASEEHKAATPAPAAVEPSLPRAPAAPSGPELMEKVYDLYKHDRGVSGRPRFDLAADVADDGQNERVLIHDRDIVIFGKGFKKGTGYTYLTMQQLASSSDVLDMTARDLTGDGKAEIIVKGVIHANGPGGDKVDREVLFVFQVVNDTIKRIFAAEVARAIGHKKVSAAVHLGSSGIELGPGTAVEWTAKTYPFNQDTSPVGGLEPLILPWGGQTARYRWQNGSFSK